MAPVPSPLPKLRVVAIAEAISWLLLLGTILVRSMTGEHLPVRICGMIHGLLFLLLLWLLFRARFEAQWPKPRLWLLFAASLVPLWPFFLDRRMRQWIAETPVPGGTS
jgi:integral membrane protein